MILSRKNLLSLVLSSLLFIPLIAFAQAEIVSPGQEAYSEFLNGKVVKINSTEKQDIFQQHVVKQFVTIGYTEEKSNSYKEIEAVYNEFFSSDEKTLKPGDRVVVSVNEFEGERIYEVIDRYRLPSLQLIIAIFCLLVIGIAGRYGFTALAGLVFSFFVIFEILLPGMIAGKNIYSTTGISALLIVLVNYYLAHGLKKKTIIAFASTAFTVCISLLFAYLSIRSARLFGVATDTSTYVNAILGHQFDTRGLLMSGMIIGLIGVLDDVIFTQISGMEEIYKANTLVSKKELFWAGFRIGKQHIIAMVNTLFLVYVAVSLPLLLLIKTNVDQPLWVVLNSEVFAEEAVRTFVSTSSLILAIPIVTILTAYFLTKTKITTKTISPLTVEKT